MNAAIPAGQLHATDDFDPFAGGAIERIVPTTEAQREIWLADHLSAEASLAYNESALIHLTGPLHLDDLQAALQALMDRHDALRATFGGDGSDLSINATQPFQAAWVDLRAHAPSQQTVEVQAACDRAVLTRFDLSTGPLVRAELLCLADQQHTLILTAHHLVCDGYSLGVLVRDLSANYRWRRQGAHAQPVQAPESFGDYALLEAQEAGSERLRADERYWLEVFKGELPVLDLPLDHPRPPMRDFDARMETLRVPADLVDSVRKLGARQGTSLFATLFAAFGALMSRLSGAPEVVIGVPAAGQSVHGRENLVGHCVQLLPIRLAVGAETPLAELLVSARTTVFDAYDHARVTYGSLLKQLPIARDPSRPPLVAVMFNVDAAISSDEVSVGDLRIEVGTNPRRFDNFELFLNCSQHAGELVLELQYNTSLFERSTAQRWLHLYRDSLARAVADATQNVAGLLAPTVEELRLLEGFNPPATAFPSSERVELAFERRAAAQPDAVALVTAVGPVSYRELKEQANAVAQALQARGIKAGDLVGLHCGRNRHMVAAQLGILKAGAGYVPLDPAFPADRLNFMAQDAALTCVVVDGSTVDGWPAVALLPDVVLCVDALMPLAEAPVPTGSAEDVAYLIYTSGSTGQPKGVRVPHRAVVNFLQTMAREPGMSPSDRILAVTTLSFDIAVLELLLPLSVGASIILATREQASDGTALRELLETHQATLLQATPSTWRILLDAGWPGARGFRGLIGGEALPSDLVPALLQRCDELWNMYGPTETTVWSSIHRVALAPGAVPIGRPVANTQFHVLDEAGRRLPLGVLGELYIGGAGVTLGYHERPDLTEERFLPDPFAASPGARIYRTGDRGRWRSDGVLECHGRLDHQVKLRGYRIELGEIETQLSLHASVAQALVVVREDHPGDQRLVAYVVAREQAPAEHVWREHLSQSLPSYMVPQHFVVLAELPLLPNGKTDRKALPAPQAGAGSQTVASAALEAPRDETEAAVAQAMAQVLSVSSVGLHQNFFELGGHSLLATQLLTRLAVATGKRVGLRALFESPTVARLASHYRDSAEALLRIPRRADRDTAALAPVQQRMWFIENFQAGTNVHNVPSGHRLRGPLKLAAFRRAIDVLIERQEALRSVVERQGDRAIQRILPASPGGEARLPFADLSDLTAQQQAARLDEELTALIRQPIDVEVAPILRMRLYRLGPQEHLFFFMTHHLFWDGFSFDVLYREMAAIYPACADESGATPLPAPLPLSYADYAQWQHDRMQGSEAQRQTAYWLEQLTPLPPPLELPLDKPRPAVLDNEGATHPLRLSEALTDSLSACAKTLGTTVYAVVLSAYAVLLRQWSRQDAFVVGTPVWGRDYPDLDRMMGAFINVLPLSMRLDPSEPFARLVDRVRKQTTDGLVYPDVPFEQVVEALRLPRDASRTPVYQAMFSFQDVRERLTRWGDLVHERAPQKTHASAQDLGFWVVMTAAGLEVQVRYNTNLFEASTARAFGAAYEHVLEQVVRNAQVRVGALASLSAADAAQLQRWNDTRVARLGDERLTDALARQVERNPAAVALVGDLTLSYAELGEGVARLARVLRSRGIGRGDLVGLCLERGSAMVVAQWAILASGAAYVPLDPAYPAERLAYMVEDARLSLVVTQSDLTDRLHWPRAQTVLIDADADRIAAESSAPLDPEPARDARRDDPAYVIYTSGSTGKPKGVVVPHGAVINFLHSMAREPGLKASDRVLAVTTLSFDIAVLELLLPLSVGACVILASRDDTLDGAALRRLLERHEVTLMQATPSTWRMLIDAGWQGRENFKALIGGEGLPSDLARELVARTGELWNMYGPTETTVWSTCWKVVDLSRGVSIGRPIDNTVVRVLDEQLQPCPIGVPGELWIGGEGVTTGYLHREELTAERFRADPFEPGGRLYRTGDRGRWRTDGLLEHLGRLDFQVKVRGHRIELGEIEVALGTHPALSRVVVIVREDAPGDQRLVAYLVAPHGLPSVAQLREHLRASLPDYMLPQHFVEMPAIPLLPNGKIDRHALPRPQAEGDLVGLAAGEAPQTPTERMLAEIWCALLQVSQVSRQDSFFQLGGHSLLSMQMIARVEQACGVGLRVRTVFDAPDLQHLAAEIDVQAGTAPNAALRIPRRSDQTVAPLSLMQQRVLFMEELFPGRPTYNIRIARRLRGPLDANLLQRAFAAVVQRQAALRTVLVRDEQMAHQEVLADIGEAGALALIDGSGPTQDLCESRLADRLEAWAAEPFALWEGTPLFRARLVRLADDEHVFVLIAHHLIFDGWSAVVLDQELGNLYAAGLAGRTLAQPAPGVSYGDYAVWHRAWVEADAEQAQGQLAYWRERLSPLPEPLALPADWPRPTAVSNRAGSVSFALSASVRDALQGFAQAEGASPFMVLLAGYYVFLARHAGQSDLVVGLPVRGRSQAEVESVIGFFANTLALRLDVRPEETFRSMVGRVRQVLLDGMAHPDVPFERLVQDLGVPREESRFPIYQAFFGYQDLRQRADRWGAIDIEPVSAPMATIAEDVALWMAERSDGIDGQFTYASDLFEADSGELFTRHLTETWARLLAQPDTALADVVLVSPADEAALTAWNSTARPVDRTSTVHGVVAAAAERHAGSPALTLDGARLTHAQLQSRSNVLARALRERGVGRGQLVGLAIERSLDMVVAQLAILKSGAGYVPLDPAYPRDRLAHMVEDARLSLVVSTVGVLAGLPWPRERTLLLDEDSQWFQTLSGQALTPDAALDAQAGDPAYVIYTSGSTGKPKGVVVPHCTVVNFLQSMAREPGLKATDRLLAVTTLSFDIAVLELLLPLTVGATVILASRDDAMDGAALRALLEHHEATAMQATPSTWRMLIDAGWQGHDGFKALIGGEGLPSDLARQLLDRTGELWNMYGPTETTVWSTCWKVNDLSKGVSIGRPIDNTVVRILDERLQPCPIGVPGEIWIGGDGVATGYLYRDELTAERFVADPFEPGARLYRTGDRGRWRTDGLLEHQGRLDFQVKVRGHRIELGEIEATLVTHPEVSRAVVIVREDLPGDQRLVAYLVCGQGLPSVTLLRDHLRGSLPDYMLPQHFVEMPAIPLLPNGKIDRSALPAPRILDAAPTSAVEDIALSESEAQLAQLWTELLGVRSPRREDNFFDLGGSSMLAMRAIASMAQATGKRIKVRHYIFETLEGIANAYDQAPVEAVQEKPKSALFGRLGSLFQRGR